MVYMVQNIQNWLKTVPVPGNMELGPPIAVTMLLFSQPGPSSRRDFSCTTNFSWDEKVADHLPVDSPQKNHPSWHPQGRDLRSNSFRMFQAVQSLECVMPRRSFDTGDRVGRWLRSKALSLHIFHLIHQRGTFRTLCQCISEEIGGAHVFCYTSHPCRGCCCWCCQCCCCCRYGGSDVLYDGNCGKFLSQLPQGHLNIHCSW